MVWVQGSAVGGVSGFRRIFRADSDGPSVPQQGRHWLLAEGGDTAPPLWEETPTDLFMDSEPRSLKAGLIIDSNDPAALRTPAEEIPVEFRLTNSFANLNCILGHMSPPIS